MPKLIPQQPLIQALIVEHSEDDLLILQRELANYDIPIKVDHVMNLANLADRLNAKSYDIVFTDHNMPGFTSSHVISIVKAHNDNLPIIIVSGYIGEDLAVEALKTGADDYILKDNFKRLIPAIRRELRDAKLKLEKKQAESLIQHMAYHDSLTGLDNRAKLEENCLRLIDNAKQKNIEHALLFMDLDRFKIINDRCGHIAGDELLKQISSVFQSCIRTIDTLSRLGGDEFCILLENCPIKKAKQIANGILHEVACFRFSWQNSIYTLELALALSQSTKTQMDTIKYCVTQTSHAIRQNKMVDIVFNVLRKMALN